ncbi:MAG: hypothetical protein LBS56_03310 [Propionibacteriaceae bacterium]|jgi:hypothetical protein|nr:hypothetical protein [Propionibacteriaceae bacterium]
MTQASHEREPSDSASSGASSDSPPEVNSSLEADSSPEANSWPEASPPEASPSPEAAYAALVPRRSRRRGWVIGIVVAALAAAAWFSPYFARPSLLSQDRQASATFLSNGRFVLTQEVLQASGAPAVVLSGLTNPGPSELLGIWVADWPDQEGLADAFQAADLSESDVTDPDRVVELLRAAGLPLVAEAELPASIAAGETKWLFLLWRAAPTCPEPAETYAVDLALRGIGPVSRVERFEFLADPRLCPFDSLL